MVPGLPGLECPAQQHTARVRGQEQSLESEVRAGPTSSAFSCETEQAVHLTESPFPSSVKGDHNIYPSGLPGGFK